MQIVYMFKYMCYFYINENGLIGVCEPHTTKVACFKGL